jgi:transposase
MKLLYRRCAGLDVHKKTVSVCIRIRRGGKPVEIEEAVFGTFTADLVRLRDWLKQHKVKQVAMESTGVYWIPIWNVLEPVRYGFELLLVNPQLVRALRGCKTDRIDAHRIAEFLQYGLLRGSFVPPRPVRELRDLTRMRVHLQQDRNRVINRIGRLLETGNVKLGSVVSNIVGKSGQLILQAIAQGWSEPEDLAKLAVGRLRYKRTELTLALNGRYSDHFRWLLRGSLEELQWLDGKVAELDGRISEAMQPHADLIRRLCTIPGVNQLTAWLLVAELGLNMDQFPDADHAASWAGLCPGNAESAGKRFSGKTRKGDRYLRRTLVQSAWAVAHKQNCFLTAVFYRTASRRGLKKAAVAVAHRILIIAYHIIRDGGQYREYGGDYFDRRQPERTARRLARRLERIGYAVVAKPLNSEADAPVAEIRGAPGRRCKCAERDIACTHLAARRVVSWSIREGPEPKQPPSSASATPVLCKQCHAWGIACIHARNQKLHTHFSAVPPEPTS